MDWRGYLLFGFLSFLLALVGVLLWPINFVSMLLIWLAGLPWEWCGHLSPASGWGGLGPISGISLLWPLTLAPLHWLNYRVLKRRGWMYFGLFWLVNLLLAVGLLVCNYFAGYTG
ncbi:MAG: hypothetical protein JO117_11325 [Verrucomicrobia bacterium]|nr:hypothetical protein [Verrucomicrobiota bacterium]